MMSAVGKLSGALGAWCVAAAIGCSSSDRPPFAETNPGLGCGGRLRTCDIHDEGCRQDVLDAVACLRGYDEQVRQPAATFITLDDLLAAADDAPEPDALATLTRSGYALFGLISSDEVEEQAAQLAQADSIAAFYSPSDDHIYVLENPGGQPLSEQELGVSVDAYLMTVLAHEYVHFLQDLEFDLDDLTDELPARYDPALAVISAVEGEAVLFEGFFSFALSGRPATADGMFPVLESFVDFAETSIRSVASPLLEARGVFPYTYGAHSAAVLYFEEDAEAVAELRRSSSTLDYVQRRWSTVQYVQPFTPAVVGAPEGFEELGDDTIGAWLTNAFWSRAFGASTEEGLAIAQRWQGDQLYVWGSQETGEVLAQWRIDVGPTVTEWESAASAARPSSGGGTWFAQLEDERLVLTASNVVDSAAAARLVGSGSETMAEDEESPEQGPHRDVDGGVENAEPDDQSASPDAGGPSSFERRFQDRAERLQVAQRRLQVVSASLKAQGAQLRLPPLDSLIRRHAATLRMQRLIGAKSRR